MIAVTKSFLLNFPDDITKQLSTQKFGGSFRALKYPLLMKYDRHKIAIVPKMA